MIQPAISLQNFRMVFPRPKQTPFTAIEDLSLDIAPGQVFGLLGPNGSGKTTTVNALCGLIRPTSGRLSVLGLDVTRQLTSVRKVLGVVPQETALYNDLTAAENLHFHARFYQVPGGERKQRMAEVLELVGLTARQHDRVGTYSGGMQRRLALARALLTAPQVVILDEPTLGVDVQSRAALWERIRQIAREGRTVLLTTNYMEEAQALADDIAILDRGKLIARGTSAELRGGAGQYVEIEADLSPAQLIALQELDGVAALLGTPPSIRLNLKDGTGTFQTILAYLNAQQITPRALSLRQPDLNDVFIELTGRALRD